MAAEQPPPPNCTGKLFKKCKSTTFQIDGATYTIEQGSLTVVRRSSGKQRAAKCEEVVAPTAVLTAGRREGPGGTMDGRIEELVPSNRADACEGAASRLRALLNQLQAGKVPVDALRRDLAHAARVLDAVLLEDGVRRLTDEDDELSEVEPDAVPAEVREWLASTFTRQLATGRRRGEDKPKFRSVAHAIRAGIFVERMYRRVGQQAATQVYPAEVQASLRTLDEWNFDVFSLHDCAGTHTVKYVGHELLNRYGLVHKFKIPTNALETFLGRVEDGYLRYKNPYHNNIHAADVAQTVHFMLWRAGLANWLTDLEVFATLVAALIHDFEHTGTTNNFHVMSRSDKAILYNDRAVLENHHLSSAFKLMLDSDCDVLQNLSAQEYREFRALVIDMVLSTDMSFHFQQLKNMRALLSLPESRTNIDKTKVLSLVLHSSDISHPAKQWRTHSRWTNLLLEEFFRQGDLEKELGLPFSPLCDRNNTLVAESQIGFIEFIVDPSMALCGDVLDLVLAPMQQEQGAAISSPRSRSAGAQKSPGLNSGEPVNKPWIVCLAENKKIWKEQAAKDAEQRAAQEKPPSATNN